MKRILTQDEMLDLIEVDGADVIALSDRIREIRGNALPAWLLDGAASGKFHFRTVTYNARKIGVFWFSFEPFRGTLLVHACASLVSDDVFCPFMAGILKQAKIVGASAVEWQTARRGLVAKCRPFGFQVVNVVLRKEIA